MDALAQYALFFAKCLTFVVSFIAVASVAAAIAQKNKAARLSIEKLNDKFSKMQDGMMEETLDKEEYKARKKEKKKLQKALKNTDRKRIFVLRFEGDIRATAVESLREEISAVLTIATPNDEVLLCLESSGGMVHAYGLAASQLQRIKDQKIPLIVAIDKVAASGGYLMSCLAQKILAAPFAIVGSIGVVAQLPNFHRLLKNHNIDYELFTGGEYKRTVTLFGENTESGRQKMQQEVEELHSIFKAFVQTHRPQCNINVVSTGEHWLATKALELGLVDELTTSDDYLFEMSQQADLFEIKYEIKKSIGEKFSHFFQMLIKNASQPNTTLTKSDRLYF